MEIILLKDIDHVGYKHEVVKVKSGYGRNFLIPQGFAVIANDSNRGKLDKLIADEDAKEAAKVDDYKAMAAKLNDQSLVIKVKAGTSGKIFGSVTNIQIANAIKEQFDIEIERKKIELPEDIKMMGEYTTIVKFYKDVTATMNLDLTKD